MATEAPELSPTPSARQPSTLMRWVAAIASAIIPGFGQLISRRYRAAALWFTPIVVGTALLAYWAPDLRSLATAAVSDTVLWTVFVANIAAAVWRGAAAIDAFRGVRDEAPIDAGMAFVGAVIVGVLIAIPHLIVGDVTYDAMRLVDIAFVDGTEQPGEPVIPIGSDADLVADPIVVRYQHEDTTSVALRGRIYEPGLGDPDAVEVWQEQHSGGVPSTAPFLPLTERVGDDRITILLAGGDSGPGRGGLRTDTMIVATINPATGKAALFGFPRNLSSTPLPRGWEGAFETLERRVIERTTPPTTAAPSTSTSLGEEPTSTTTTTIAFESCDCFPEYLNALYPTTRRWTGTYPNEVDPGMAALRDVLSHVSGLDIDYYALVDMAAFVDLVDAIGGVEVYVQEPLESEVSPPREGDPWATVDVDVGWAHLDGPEALAYVRARKGSSDYVRMQRQRCMLRAIAAQASPLTLLRGFGGIVDALEGSLVTDVPISFAPDLFDMAAGLDFDDVATFGFRPGYYAHERDLQGYAIPDVDRIRQKISQVIRDQDAGVTEPGDATGSECDPEQ